MKPTWQPLIHKNEKPFYLALVRALSDDIGSGRLPLGTRLPPQRELADDLKVALGTVTRAYDEAERRGLVYGDGRRGTYVGEMPRARSLLATLSGTSSVGIDFSKNHPAPHLDPDPSGTLGQIARHPGNREFLMYPPPAGLLVHRRAGARWISTLGLKADPENLFVCAGAQHGLLAIFAAQAKAGDIIAAEEYSYPGVKAVAEMLGLQPVGIPIDREGVIPDALESICRQKDIRMLYCNPSYQNPTNAMMSSDRRRRIAAIAEKYDITLVEDEILSPFLDEPVEFMAAMLPERSYFLVSASKSVAAGLRTGFIVAPSHARQRLADTLQGISLGSPSLMAEIFTRWLDDGTVEKTIARRKQELAWGQKLAKQILKDFKVRTSGSSYHVWLELPDNWPGARFAHEAMIRGVAVAPSKIFAVERKTPISAARLSIGSVSGRETVKTGLEIIADILSGSRRHDAATV